MTNPAASKNAKPDKAADPSRTLEIQSPPDADQTKLLVTTALRPSVRAAVTTQAFSRQFGELDINALVGELTAQAKTATDGDLQRPEAMLIAQAHTLEAMFHELARRAALNMGEYLGAAETYMRLALKAQSQCRATIEALANLKNPRPVAYVQQANIGQAVQVNNQRAPEKLGNAPNELFEAQHAIERVDSGTAIPAGLTNSQVEAMGAVHRPDDGGRQS